MAVHPAVGAGLLLSKTIQGGTEAGRYGSWPDHKWIQLVIGAFRHMRSVASCFLGIYAPIAFKFERHPARRFP
jgi:hypothetical protein